MQVLEHTVAEQEIGQQQLQEQLAASSLQYCAAAEKVAAAQEAHTTAESALTQQLRRVHALEGLRLTDLQVSPVLYRVCVNILCPLCLGIIAFALPFSGNCN